MSSHAGGRRRALTLRQATRCEHADTDRCSCRCGGSLHGAYRVDDVRALEVNDMHFPGNEMKIADAALEEREWRRRE